MLQFSIHRLLLAIISFLCLLVILNYGLLRYFQSDQEKDTMLVDVSGRNRMLSQKISFLATLVYQGNMEAIEPLEKATELHHESLMVLKEGGFPPGTERQIEFHSIAPNLLPTLEKTEVMWQQFRFHALQIARIGNVAPLDRGVADQKRMETALQFMVTNAQAMLSRNNDLVQAFVKSNAAKQRTLNMVLLVLLFTNLITALGALWLFHRYLILPIRAIAKAAAHIAKGSYNVALPDHGDPDIQKIVGSINRLEGSLNRSAQFARSIGNGVFDQEISESDTGNQLTEELMHMRDKLKAVAESDAQRNWQAAGMAELANRLRSNTHQMEDWAAEMLSFCIQYLNMNQGSFFVMENDEEGTECLELKASYAWERRKYNNKRIYKGEGLVGTSWFEQDEIYMTQVPESYINIRSGLGHASPTSDLLFQIVKNVYVIGLIELAAFQEMTETERSFCQQACESIAAALAATRTNAQTELLLQQSQDQTAAMQAQEEEMRQNMEELQATQEELTRRQSTIDQTLNTLDRGMVRIQIDVNHRIQEASVSLLQCM
ncbi:MAG: GAF domain-containing protein [Salibacteraceae bacterium]